MVALTYDVRTVRIPIPRLVIGAGRRRLQRARRPVVHGPHWVRAERALTDRRRDAHRDAALAARVGAGF